MNPPFPRRNIAATRVSGKSNVSNVDQPALGRDFEIVR
jgi:hypothetical protein